MIDFTALAKKFGTPLYVYDAAVMRNQVAKAKSVVDGLDYEIVFAEKANSNPALLKIMAEMGIGADVVSPGEYHGAKLAGMKTILWNGNGKTKADRDFFLEEGIDYVCVDSFEELEMWEGIQITKILRVNPNVDAKTHRHISTGMKKHKFGVPIDEIHKVADKIDGLHVHIGSQITQVKPFVEAYTKVVDLSNKYGFKTLDIGGGWGIGYTGEELNSIELREAIYPVLEKFNGKIILELGRYLIGPAGYLVLEVVSVKDSGDKVFVVANSGMNALIRPALYDAHHGVIVMDGTGEVRHADVVGPLCETGDILATGRELEIPVKGSFIAMENAGAYGYSMSNNYNGMPRPAEILVDSENVKLIRSRETVEDLFKGTII